MEVTPPTGGRLARGTRSILNLLGDLASLLLSLTFSLSLSGPPAGAASLQFFVFAGAACLAWIVGASVLHYYTPPYGDSQRDLVDDVTQGFVMVMAITSLLVLVEVTARPLGLPRPGLFLLLFAPAVLLLRILVFRPLSSREGPVDEALIVGTGAIARLTGEDLARRGRRVVLGYFRFAEEPERNEEVLLRKTSGGNPPALFGAISSMESVLRDHPVSEVYIAGDVRKHGPEMQEAIRVCEKFGIPFALPAYGFCLERAQPVHAQAVSDGYLHYQSVKSNPRQMALKRLFDVVASSIALAVLMPGFVIVAALIKVTSRGPVFFRQQRVGLHGASFNMLKFRSMVVNAEELKEKLARENEQTGPVFKMKRDPRVTRIGRFIRRYSIDELPQLINVVRGDMSIVGPRPPVPKEVAHYEAWQRRRLSVRPGLTCIWQVSGRNQISFEQWMYLDMQYIDNWSFIRDFNLIFRTVPAVFTGRGAS